MLPNGRRPAKQAGRVANALAETIQQRIRSGELVVGQYLTNVRDLGRAFGVSPETARRALQSLVAQHWLTVQPGHGFRVTARVNNPTEHAPIAFIMSAQGDGPSWSGYHGALLASIHRAAAGHGWSVLGLGAQEGDREVLIERICRSRVAGLLVDTPDTTLIARLQRIGLPVVLLEERAAGCDAVAQDNYAGVQLAVQHLLEHGCRRFAWFGAITATIFSRMRWAGAMAALRDGPGALVADGCIDDSRADAAERLSALLARERPDAIIAPWPGSVVTACRVVRGSGRDLHVVGWSAEQMLPELRDAFAGRLLPDLVTWSMDELAQCALARLAERRARPDAFPVSIAIGMRLRPAEDRAEQQPPVNHRTTPTGPHP